jgi:hypothetical protein
VRFVIDLYGLTAEEVRDRFPTVYQHLLAYVKPDRDVNPDSDLREKWWLHRRSNDELRRAVSGLSRYIATVMTAKHRLFVFIDSAVLPDQMLVAIGTDSHYRLGVLSSRLHVHWAIATGARLGVGNDSRYNKTRCFETFAFCADTTEHRQRIARVAELLEAHRRRVQAQSVDLTLTTVYNVLEKLRRNEPLTAKEKVIHDHGLVSVLRELHDDLDRAVFAAYGWNDLADALVGKPGATTPYPEKSAEQAAAEEELLSRLVALNAERAAEEARGVVRWLRPEFQAKAAQVDPNGEGEQRGEQRGEQGEMDVETEPETDVETEAPAAAGTAAPLAPAGKRVAWPSTLPEQIRLVADTVAAAPQGLDLDQLAARFTGRGAWKKRLPDIVDSLTALGRVRPERSGDRVVLHG